MDFIAGVPRTTKRHDAIWVVMDRLTKAAHFLALKTTYISEQLANLYIKEITTLLGIPLSIVSDHDNKFVYECCHGFQTTMGTELHMSTAFHPQTDGQSERTIQTLEDMLISCTINYASSWNHNLPLVEFAYNNSYHASIRVALLYGR